MNAETCRPDTEPCRPPVAVSTPGNRKGGTQSLRGYQLHVIIGFATCIEGENLIFIRLPLHTHDEISDIRSCSPLGK